MLGTVASKFLMKYLSEYIVDLDSKHLDMKLWKGNATFQDLVLKETALSKHDLPLKVVKGILGTIDVCFPWKKLSTEPTKISISNVFILVKPDSEVIIKNDVQASDDAFHIGTSEQVKNQNEEKNTLLGIFNTVIDNLEITVNNIHIRLEYAIEEGNTVSCGFLIPSLTFYTVNEEGERVQKMGKRELKVYKKLDVHSISAYFDTTQILIDLDDFKQQMLNEISGEHQFILNPFSVIGMFTHNRNPGAEFKNTIEFIAKNLHFSVDLMQCRTLQVLNKNWSKFNLHRKYAHIKRPKDVNDYQKMFSYTAKCAIAKARPNQFNPSLAFAFLKNRKMYVSLVKEKKMKKTAAAFKSLFGKNELAQLTKSIGPETTFYLKHYADIIVNKQAMIEESQNSGIDLSAIQGITEVQENLFTAESVNVCFNISCLQLELNYFADMPLFRLVFDDISSYTNSTGDILQNFKIKKGYAFYFDPQNTKCTFQNEEGKLIYQAQDLNIAYNSPKFDTPSFDCKVSPIFMSFDAVTIKYAFEFLRNDKDITPGGTIIDLGEQLQILRKLRTTKCNIFIPNISIALPYVDNDVEKQFKLSIDSIKFSKEGQLITEKPVFTSESGAILKEVKLDDDVIVSDANFVLNESLQFYECSYNVDVLFNISLNGAKSSISNQACTSMQTALNYMNAFMTKKGSKNNSSSESTVSLSKIHGGINVNLNDIMVSMMHKGMLRSTANVNGLAIGYDLNDGLKNAELASVNVQQYGSKYVDLVSPKINIKNGNIEVFTENLFFVFDYDYINWILSMVSTFSSDEEPTSTEEDNTNIKISLVTPHIELAYNDDDNIILQIASLDVNMDDKGIFMNLDKVSAMHYERQFLSEITCAINLVNTDFGSSIDLAFPYLSVGLDPIEFKEMMDTLMWYLKITADPPGTPVSESIIKFNVAFSDGVELNGYNREHKIFITNIPSITVSGQVGNGSLSVDVSIPKMSANYCKGMKFIDIEDMKIDYQEEGLVANINIDLNIKEVGLTYCTYNWAMGMLDGLSSDESPEEKADNPQSTMIIKVNQCPTNPIKASLISEWKDYLDITVSSLGVECRFEEESNIYVDITDINVTSQDLPGITFAEVPSLNVHMQNNGVNVEFQDSVEATTNVPFINKLLDVLTDIFTDHESESSDFGMGLGITLPYASVHLLSFDGNNCLDICVDNIVGALKIAQKLGYLSMDSIKVLNIYSQYGKTKNDELVNIEGISALFSFRDDEQFLPVETILNEPHSNSKDPINLDKFNSIISVNNVEVTYTHTFAQNIIKCIPFKEKLVDEQNISCDSSSIQTPSSSASSSVYSTPIKSAAKPKSKMIIKDLSITFLLFEPLAIFKLSNINARLDNNWSADIGGFLALDKEGHSYITCPHDGKKFFRFEMRGEKFFVKLRETNLFFDYTYWIKLASFIIRSPILFERFTETEDGSSELVSPSLELTFKAPGFTIKLPTNYSRNGQSSGFYIRLNTVVKIATGVISATMSKFSINYQDQHSYPPLFDNVSFSFETKQSEDGNLSNKVSLSDIEAKISASDIIGFNAVRSHFEKALSEVTFPVFSESDSSTKSKQPPSEIDIRSGNTNIIFCKDNRSSTQYIPLFKVVIPPIVFRLSSIDSINCVSFDIGPYINFFNDVTGNYDDIVEPVDLHIISSITDSAFLFKLETNDIININLPLNAIDNYMKIIRDVKNSIEKSQLCNDFPSFWVSNQVDAMVKFNIKTSTPGNEDMMIMLDFDQIIPIYNADTESKVEVEVGETAFSFVPSTIVFPVIIADHFTVSKKPYQGGIAVEVAPICEIQNDLDMTLSVFHQFTKKGNFIKKDDLKPGKRYPLLLKQQENIIFTEKNATSKSYKPLSFGAEAYTNILFPIVCKEGTMYAVRTVENEKKTGRRLFRIKSTVTITSNLPLPLQIVQHDGKMLNIQSNVETSLSFVDPTQKKVILKVSLDGMQFFTWTVVLNTKDTQMFRVKYPITNSYINLAVKVDRTNAPFISISVFVPSIIFNTTKRSISYYAVAKKLKVEETRVDPNMVCFCSPATYMDDGECNAVFKFDDSHYSDALNLVSTANGTLYNTTDNENLFMPVRYDITKSGLSNVMTFSEVLIVENKLPMDIKLQPIFDIPKVSGDEGEVVGLSVKADIIDQSVSIPPNAKVPITRMSKNGTFLFSIDGYLTQPSLCLTTNQRTAYRVQSEGKIYNIELNVVDNGCSYVAVFKPAKFPTPFVITNELDTQVQSYQMITENKFVTDSQASSIFTFDEPFAYPCAHFVIDDLVVNISLTEDTDYVKLEQTLNGKPIYVAVKLTTEGFRTIILAHELPTYTSQFNIRVPIHVAGIAVSLINQNMEEVCLLSMSDIGVEFNKNGDGSCVKAKISEISLDDQHPNAVVESVITGKKIDNVPFFIFDAIMPPDTPLFTSFEYVRIRMQKVNIDLDHAFVADIYHLFDDIFGRIEKRIVPLKPDSFASDDGNQRKISIGYLELTPMIITASFKTSSNRPIETEELPYMSIIPSIKGIFNMSGLVLAQTTDTVSNILSMIREDYTTALFNQAIEMLGFGGKIMTSFGVSSAIAEALGVKIHNDVDSDTKVLDVEEKFDNRRESKGLLSKEKMEFINRRIGEFKVRNSAIVTSLAENKPYEGLSFKSLHGSGFDSCIFGVVNELMTDERREDAEKYSQMKFVRKRIPRAYPWNAIQAYDKLTAKVQTQLQKSMKQHSRILLSVEINKNTHCYVTDTYVALADVESGSIVTAMMQKAKISMDSNTNAISITTSKGNINVTCATKAQADILFLFIQSQKKYLDIFHVSII